MIQSRLCENIYWSNKFVLYDIFNLSLINWWISSRRLKWNIRGDRRLCSTLHVHKHNNWRLDAISDITYYREWVIATYLGYMTKRYRDAGRLVDCCYSVRIYIKNETIWGYYLYVTYVTLYVNSFRELFIYVCLLGCRHILV